MHIGNVLRVYPLEVESVRHHSHYLGKLFFDLWFMEQRYTMFQKGPVFLKRAEQITALHRQHTIITDEKIGAAKKLSKRMNDFFC